MGHPSGAVEPEEPHKEDNRRQSNAQEEVEHKEDEESCGGVLERLYRHVHER